MLGSPLLRALVAFLVLLSLAYPLRRLTRGEAGPRPATERGTPAETALRLHITFTNPPKSLQVLHLGKEIWRVPEPSAELTHELKLPFPAEGVDLQFQVEFPEGAPLAAMRVRLTDPAGNEHEKTLWGQGRIEDVLTFP